MKFLKFLLFISFCALFNESSGFAQNDSVVNLSEVTILSPRFKNFNTGHSVIMIDSFTKALNNSGYVRDILNHSSSLLVNSYGAGASSISGRGTGEKRTPVLWNGFNIQSIQLAGTDVAQLPSIFFEDVKVQMGGESALFGSGAVGGLVHLSNSAVFNQGVKAELGSSVGSYSQYMNNAKFSFSNNSYASSVKAFYYSGLNNFPYKATYKGWTGDTLIKAKQYNANAKLYGIMVNNFVRISGSQQVNFHFWYQNNDKNIAPTLYDVASKTQVNATQKDILSRGSVEWNLWLNKVSLHARTGLFSNKLDYLNPAGWDSSYSSNLSSISELESNYSPLNFIKLNTGINYTYEEASSTAFSKLEIRKRSAFFASLKLEPIPDLQLSVNVRDELVNGNAVPLTFSSGLEYTFLKIFTARGHLSKNYRLPSFNDLFFKNAYSEGNPDLKPESSVNYEAALSLNKQFENIKIKAGSTYFQSKMDSWINWAMSADSNIWTVYNIDKAEMNGLESIIEINYLINKTSFGLKGMHTYVYARDRNTLKHLTYVPEHKTLIGITFCYMGFSAIYQHIVSSDLYSRSGNAGKMDGYSLGNIVVNQSVKVKKININLGLQIKNLWNSNYMTVLNYPMPGRNYMAELKFIY